MRPILRACLFAALLTACVSRSADLSPAAYLGAGMAGLNNPNHSTGDSDNLAVTAGGKVPLGLVTLRPEAHVGDHSVQFTPAATWDFALAGEGPGSIDGSVGLGWSFVTRHENNILGDEDSPFLRVGAEGYLVHGIVVGAALMLAPWGYDHEDVALAGVVYAGLRL
jgi:hypothetical protein